MVSTVGKFWWVGGATLHLAEKSVLSVFMIIPGPLRFKEKDKKRMGKWLCLLISPWAILFPLKPNTSHLPRKKNLVLKYNQTCKTEHGVIILITRIFFLF